MVIIQPASFPRTADWVSTKILSGPGAKARRIEVEKKAASMFIGISILVVYTFHLYIEIFVYSFAVS
jgi:hypothetical protein